MQMFSRTKGHSGNRGICAPLGIAALLFCAGSTFAQSINAVYVETNIGNVQNKNSVFAFSNDGSGHLTQLPGSPYLTSGTGFYDPGADAIGTDHQVIINSAGTLLFAVNAYSNTIAVFNINSDATLTPVAGSPFSSVGIEPVSLALSEVTPPGETLTVANRAIEPGQKNAVANLSTFLVSPNGALSNLSITSLGKGANDVLVTSYGPNGQFLVEAQLGPSLLNSELLSYSMQSNGVLDFVNLQHGRKASYLGNVAHPTQPFLYVGDPSTLPAQVRVYSWDTGTGALTYLQSAPNTGQSICWLAINPAGTRLYTAENSSGSLSVYDTSVPDNPNPIQHFILSGTPSGPTNLALDPTGKFLYVVDVAQLDLHVLNINPRNGTLSETLPTVPLPGLSSANQPIGLATILK